MWSEQVALRKWIGRQKDSFDLGLFVNSHSIVNDEILDAVREKCRMVGLWMLDEIETLPTSGLSFGAFDCVATFNARQVAALGRLVGSDVAYVPQGYAPIRVSESPNWSDCPLILGAAYPSRRGAASALGKAGLSVELVGRTWPQWTEPSSNVRLRGDVSLPESVAISARGRICVNGHRSGNSGVSPRVFEIGGAGGLIVTDNERASDFFEPGEEMLLWSDAEELVAHVCRSIHEPERAKAIAKKGHARVIAEHSLDRRFGDLFKAWGL